MAEQEAINEIIDELGISFENFGFPKAIGTVWGTLYFKGDMTQEELRKELDCSLSAVSQSLNILEKLGSVYISDKSGRKKVYSANDSLKKTMKKRMDNLNRLFLQPMIDTINENEKLIHTKELKNKTNTLKNKCEKGQTMIKLISRFHKDD